MEFGNADGETDLRLIFPQLVKPPTRTTMLLPPLGREKVNDGLNVFRLIMGPIKEGPFKLINCIILVNKLHFYSTNGM